MPSLRQLEYLVALSDTRNFRRAAERTGTTQPTLSEQIKALEDRLGTQLVERSRSGILLTQAGSHVAEIARRMLKDAAEIRSIAGGDSAFSGVLKVGLPSTIGPYLLPTVVPELHVAYPNLKLYVREELPDTLARSLEDGVYDVIITPLPLRGDQLTAVELFREPLFLTVAADHPLASKSKVTRTDLSGQEILTLGRGHQLHNVVLTLCEEFGARVRLDYEGTSLDMVREMVITGLGITFMPGLYVRRELTRDASLKILQIHGRSIYRMIGMAWRKSSARHDSFKQIAELFRTVVRREFADLSALG
ncbi:MAG: LysR family transcriptional regulator [Hyphomicrobiales bacterium]|nr:LysR family transcriptional regulator [Hyphomicrobiales bacterium]